MVIVSDCRLGMATLPANSVDALVTDPPYGLSKQPDMREVLRHWLAGDDFKASGSGFMGKSWDSFVPGPATWAEALRVMKPGAYGVVFAGSRTVDLMSTSLRLAGFEVLDMLHWLYGSGFPKSLNVAREIDKRDGLGAQLAKRLSFTAFMRMTGVTPAQVNEATGSSMASHYFTDKSQPAVPTRAHMEAIRPLIPFPVPQWVEDLVDERETESENLKRREVVGTCDRAKPTSNTGNIGGDAEKNERQITKAYSTEAQQWEGWGTALKPCHEPIILVRKPLQGSYASNIMQHGVGALNIDGCRLPDRDRTDYGLANSTRGESVATGTPSKSADFDTTKGRWPGNVLHDGCLPEPMDRYFYCAKASKADREDGLADFSAVTAGEATGGRKEGSAGLSLWALNYRKNTRRSPEQE